MYTQQAFAPQGGQPYIMRVPDRRLAFNILKARYYDDLQMNLDDAMLFGFRNQQAAPVDIDIDYRNQPIAGEFAENLSILSNWVACDSLEPVRFSHTGSVLQMVKRHG